MQLIDSIYGKFEITSPILLDLINSPSLQRLKKISQYGVPDELYFKKSFSRYEHSIGVMLLLSHFRSGEEEQIAGLLHDISHTAFSHVYDWVAEEGKDGVFHENLQDARHKQFLSSSEIPGILAKYDYSTERISDYHHFKLLERDSPELCADRVDYSLREIFQDNPKVAKRIFAGLGLVGSKIICNNSTVAKIYAQEFLKLHLKHWGGIQAVSRYHYFSKALKKALDLNLITHQEFLGTEDRIMFKLSTSSDPEIKKIVRVLRDRDALPESTGKRVYKKFRYIDPEFMKDARLVKLSSVDRQFQTKLAAARLKNSLGHKV